MQYQEKILGILISLLGVIVITGWFIGSERLVQINPHWAPMQFNTALGFLAVGSLLFLRASIKKLISYFLILLSLLTISQYVFGINLGIDELFMKHDIITQTSHAGRMAIPTNICFLLCGIWGTLFNGARFLIIMLIFFISLFSMAGYAVDLNTYQWFGQTSMAIHTAVGFFMFSIAGYFITFRERMLIIKLEMTKDIHEKLLDINNKLNTLED